MMFKFGGFKASLDFLGRRKKENLIDATTHSVNGAYRINRDEFNDFGRNSVTAKLSSSAAAKHNNPSIKPPPTIKPNKSASDLIMQKNLPQNVLSKSTPDVSQHPRGGTNAHSNKNVATGDAQKQNVRTREHVKMDKQQLAQQKARDKAIAKEQAKQDKLRRDMEKQAAKDQARIDKLNKRRKKAPAPPTAPAAPPLPLSSPPVPLSSPPQAIPNNARATSSYSTNTMHSSISTTSGPPPYSDGNSETNNNAGNVIFSKPIKEQTNSWDIISQHRQEMARPRAQGVAKTGQKNMVMDLQYKLGSENTDA